MPPIYTVGGHGVIGIRHGDDPCNQRDIVAGQSIRIPLAVQAFVVIARADIESGDHVDILQDLGAGGRVPLHHLVFLLRQLAGLVQDGIRNTNLSDVVQKTDKADVGNFNLGEAQLCGDGCGVLRNTAGMTSCILVLGINRVGDGGDGLQGHPFDVASALRKLVGVFLILPVYFIVKPCCEIGARKAEQ